MSQQRLVRSSQNTDDYFKKTPKEFAAHLRHLSEAFNALIVLTSALTAAGKGSVLKFPNPNAGANNWLTFDRKDLKASCKEFRSMILEFSKFLRVSRKKGRKPADPQDFSGTYAPVYLGEALITFFNQGDFGPADPTSNSSRKLMDSLPLVKGGYTLRVTITMLLFTYANHNNLRGTSDPTNGKFTRSDDFMNRVFGGNIPASFYYENELKRWNGNNPSPVNTYQAVRTREKGRNFNPNDFDTYYFQNIAAVNYFTLNNLEDLNQSNQALGVFDEQVRTLSQAKTDAENRNMSSRFNEDLLREHALVKQTGSIWKQINESSRVKHTRVKKPKQVEEFSLPLSPSRRVGGSRRF